MLLSQLPGDFRPANAEAASEKYANVECCVTVSEDIVLLVCRLAGAGCGGDINPADSCKVVHRLHWARGQAAGQGADPNHGACSTAALQQLQPTNTHNTLPTSVVC